MADNKWDKMDFHEKLEWWSNNLTILGFSLIGIAIAFYLLKIIK